MPTSKRDFRSIVIEQHLNKLFNTITGTPDFDAAMVEQKLQKHEADAIALGDIFLQGMVSSMRGVMYSFGGDFANATTFYERARDLYAQVDSDRALGMDDNLGLMAFERGRYEEAIAIYRDLQAKLKAADAVQMHRLAFTSINMSTVLLALSQHDEALALLNSTLEDYSNLLEYMRKHSNDGIFIVEQRVLIGMAQLGTGAVADAINSARLAADFLRHITAYHAVLLSTTLLVRLASAGHIPDPVQPLLDRLDADRPVRTDVTNFARLREEALHYARHNAPGLARWFGKRALADAKALNSDELIATAEAALAQAGSA